MKKITLEWNAVTTLEDKNRSGRDSLEKIIQANSRLFDVGIVTTAASENTSDRELPQTGTEFRNRLKMHGWEHLTHVLVQGRIDLTYFGLSRITSADAEEKISHLWEVLPGNMPRDFRAFAKENDIPDGESITAPSFKKWRNHWCDVFSMEAHIAANRDVFVTGDKKNFKGGRKQRLIDLGIGDICTYDEAWRKYGDE